MERKDNPQREEKQMDEDPKRTQEWERGKTPPPQSGQNEEDKKPA